MNEYNFQRYNEVYHFLTKSDSTKGIISSSDSSTSQKQISCEEQRDYFIPSDFYYWDYSNMNDITKLSNHLLDFDIRDYCTQDRGNYPFMKDYHLPSLEPVFQTRRNGGQDGFPFIRGIQVRREGEETFMCKQNRLHHVCLPSCVVVNDSLLSTIGENIENYKKRCSENGMIPTMFSTPNLETRRQLFYSTLERQNRISWSQLENVISEMTMLDLLRLENIWFKEEDSKDNTGDPLQNTDKRRKEEEKQEEKETGVVMDLQKMTARRVHIHST